MRDVFQRRIREDVLRESNPKRTHSREEMLDVEFVSILVLSRRAVVSRFVSSYSHVSVSAPLPRYVVDRLQELSGHFHLSFSFTAIRLL